MASIATVPAYPIPGDVRLVFTPNTSTYYLRLYVTAAPLGSHLSTLLDKGTTSTRYLVWEGYMDEEPTLNFDKGGSYSLQMDVFTKGASSYGGGYLLDPNSFLTETVDAVQSAAVTFNVGQRVDCRLGSAARGFATLRMWVWGDTVRPTNAQEYDMATPVIINPSTEAAHIAQQSTSVETALASVANNTATALIGDLAALCADFKAKVVAHMTNTGAAFHSNADAVNSAAIDRLPSSPSTPEGIVSFARVLRESLIRHMTNESAIPAYHEDPAGGADYPDYNNLPASDAPGGPGAMVLAVACLADAFRAYEAHRITTPSHNIADATNTMSSTLGNLLVLHKDFLDAAQSTSGTGAPQLNPGASKLVQLAGFSDTTGTA